MNSFDRIGSTLNGAGIGKDSVKVGKDSLGLVKIGSI